ncbi:hypothetical protein Q8A73_022873 [Channa argus]|nr:hypothetical protein Q8A73_022873 [Channa argus]
MASSMELLSPAHGHWWFSGRILASASANSHPTRMQNILSQVQMSLVRLSSGAVEHNVGIGSSVVMRSIPSASLARQSHNLKVVSSSLTRGRFFRRMDSFDICAVLYLPETALVIQRSKE